MNDTIENKNKDDLSHTIILPKKQFEAFIQTCECPQSPSKEILDTAKRLDEEGF